MTHIQKEVQVMYLKKKHFRKTLIMPKEPLSGHF